MVTAAEVGLRVLEVTAILLPLMGVFVQVFIRQVVQGDVQLSDRMLLIAYLTIGLTTLAIVSAGTTSILPFITGTVPIEILIPLLTLYGAYIGIGIVIILFAGLTIDQGEETLQLELSDWLPNRGDE